MVSRENGMGIYKTDLVTDFSQLTGAATHLITVQMDMQEERAQLA